MNVAFEEIRERAEQRIEKSDAGLTTEKAIAKAAEEAPELYARHVTEARGPRRLVQYERVAKHVTPSRESVTPACHASRRDVPIPKQAEELRLVARPAERHERARSTPPCAHDVALDGAPQLRALLTLRRRTQRHVVT